MLRTIFFGTPEFALPSLERVAAEHEVLAVITQPDRPKGRGCRLTPPPVKELSLRLGLPVLQMENVNTDEAFRAIAAYRPDVIVVVAFGQLLRQRLLTLPPKGCINVHASLLPELRGAAPIHRAIIEGRTVTGVTTIFMDAGMDTGDIILQKSLGIGPDETAGELHDRLKVLGAELLGETLALVAQGKVAPIPQDSSRATYAPLLTRDIERINWQEPAQNVHNLVRGLNPWPGAYSGHKGRILKIWRTKLGDQRQDSLVPGRITAITGSGFVVETGAGTLEILEVQPECRHTMSAREYASGYCLNPGEILL